ncbi:MAG: CoA-binding protein [Thermodesulfobacteriota bacterium]|nr:CoA-binding protein [Thermodesulfobacteriota bacterium]
MEKKRDRYDISSIEMKEILINSKNIAVVGLSPKLERPSYIVASFLQLKGYRIIPVRPPGPDILGEKAYPNILEVPCDIDIVDIFRKPEAVLGIVYEAIEKKAKVIWMQEGVINEQAAEIAHKEGLKVIMDRCIKKEHQKIFG